MPEMWEGAAQTHAICMKGLTIERMICLVGGVLLLAVVFHLVRCLI